MHIPGILDQALTHIISHPDQWDQSDWFCGTKACLAGRICLLAGADVYEPPKGANHQSGLVLYRGEVMPAADIAAELAGLTEWEAGYLWSADRIMPELYEAVNAIGLDLALDRWRPDVHDHYGPEYINERYAPRLVVHRRSTATANDGTWSIKHHPTRELAAAWAGEYADRRGWYLLTPDTTKDTPA